MNSESRVIEGTRTVSEWAISKSKAYSYQVQWIIRHVGAPALVDAKQLRKRSAATLNKALASSFDSADDARIDEGAI